MIVAILIICFKKTLPMSEICSQLSQKENRKGVSNPSKAIILNETDFENEESFLLNQSTPSTLTHELKNPSGLIIAQPNINSLRNKFDALAEILHSNVVTFNLRN